jgi:hypothetical protein
MDSLDDWEAKKDAKKRARYAPVLDFFNSLPEKQGWTLLQFNFTVGVRGSISNLDRTDLLSFLSTLKALGITSRVNLEKIRKATAKRAFEAHDLLLRSHYAVKSSSSSSQVDFSSIMGHAFAFQHCVRPPTLRGALDRSPVSRVLPTHNFPLLLAIIFFSVEASQSSSFVETI